MAVGGVSTFRTPLLAAFDDESLAEEKTTRVAQSYLAPTSAPAPRQPVTGKVRLELPEGNYIGEVEDEEPHGYGTLTYKTGREFKRYEGEWHEGQFWGRGQLQFTDGRRYEGEFEAGWPHGQGLAVLRDGSKYQGEFLRGHFHGKGKLTKRDGKIFEGDWCCGLLWKRGELNIKQLYNPLSEADTFFGGDKQSSPFGETRGYTDLSPNLFIKNLVARPYGYGSPSN